VTFTRDAHTAGTLGGEQPVPVISESPVGARIHVMEPGRRTWEGTVLAASLGLRCWYLQILRDDGRVRSVAAHHVF
jgi:hypothetical protein